LNTDFQGENLDCAGTEQRPLQTEDVSNYLSCGTTSITCICAYLAKYLC